MDNIFTLKIATVFFFNNDNEQFYLGSIEKSIPVIFNFDFFVLTQCEV